MGKGRGRKVGSAYVELRADNSKLSGDLESFRKETEKTAKQAEGDTKRIRDGFKSAGEQIEKNTEGFRKLSGAISSTVGIWTATIGAITIVIGLVAKLTGRIKTYGETARESIKETNQLLERQRELYDNIEAASRKALANIVAARSAEIDERYETLLASIGGRDRLQGIKSARRLGVAKTQESPGLKKAVDELLALESRRKALSFAAQRRQEVLRQQEAEAEADREVKRRADSGPVIPEQSLDSGGPFRASPGTVDNLREILGSMSRMEQRLERIENNTLLAGQP